MSVFRIPPDNPEPIYLEDNGHRYKAKWSHEFSLDEHADLIQRFSAMKTLWQRKPVDEARLDHHLTMIVQELVPGITSERISKIAFLYRFQFVMWWMQHQMKLSGMDGDDD